MPLSSMTGFARREGSLGAYVWAWELKSVNNRGLDIRVRVPGGYEALDLDIRKRVNTQLKRGSVQISLQMQRGGSAPELAINEAALTQVLQAVERLRGSVEASPPRLDGLLAIRGVLDVQEPEETEDLKTARNAALLRDFDAALAQLKDARGEEGSALDGIISGQLHQIETLLARAEGLSALQPDKLRKRLGDQLAQLMDAAATPLPEERIAHEAAILMTKADVREELDRLRAHIQAAQDLLSAAEPVGRKLDFLTQEFNREINTLCSKASDIELTRVGLDLKAVVDQMREQVQNVE